ncbi:MAG: CHAT domain-containing tetratricopeptide repeat protein [Microscillaceae bacterium]|nr:CHAT domain-containing tetratricopeptide repeat protein [Microscillaceae bacterium]
MVRTFDYMQLFYLHKIAFLIIIWSVFLGGCTDEDKTKSILIINNYQKLIDKHTQKADSLILKEAFAKALDHYTQAADYLILNRMWEKAFLLKYRIVHLSDSLHIREKVKDIIVSIGQKIYPHYRPQTNQKLAAIYSRLSFMVFDAFGDNSLFNPGFESLTFAQESLSRAYNFYAVQEKPDLDSLELLSTHLAYACYLNQNPYESIRFGSIALKYLRKSGNTKWEARVSNLMGAAHGNTESYKKAEQYFIRTLSLEKKLIGKDTNSVVFVIRYNNLAKLNYDMNKPGQSIFYLDKSLNTINFLLTEGKIPEDSLRVYLANVYFHLGWAWLCKYRVAEDKDPTFLKKAEKYSSEALKLRRKYLHKRSEVREQQVALSISHLGSIDYEMGYFDKSIQHFKRSITLLEKKSKYSEIDLPMNLFLLGRVYYQLNQPKRALYYFQKSLTANVLGYEVDNPASNPPAEGRHLTDLYFRLTILYKARSYMKLWQRRKLRYYYHMAIKNYLLYDEILSKNRRDRLYRSDQIELTAQYPDAYSEATGLSLSQKDYQLAFYFSEQSKAAVLYEQLHESSVREYAGIPDHLLQEEQKIKSEMSFYRQEIRKPLSGEVIQRYQDSIFVLDDRLTKLIKTFESKYPDYYNLKYNEKKIKIAEVQYLLDSKTVAITYVVGEKYTYILAISKKSYCFQPIKVSRKLLNRQVKSLLENISAVSNDFHKPAYKLYKYLLAPIEHFISDKQLLIIPDGQLATIPFEALISQEPKSPASLKDFAYAIKRHTIQYYPSLKLVVKALQKPVIKSFEHGLTAFMPVFDTLPPNREAVLDTSRFFMGDSLIQRALMTSEPTLNSLQLILKKGGQDVVPFLRKQASKTTIKREKINSRFLLFFTHSFVASDPTFSGIQLYPSFDQASPSENGILFLEEIFALQIQTDLIIVNSCESGVGTEIKGEGILSLGRGFMFCGVPNVMQSLWKINENSASEFLVLFFRKHLETSDASYARALHQAKIEFIKNPAYAHPYYWSPIILLGEQNLR